MSLSQTPAAVAELSRHSSSRDISCMLLPTARKRGKNDGDGGGGGGREDGIELGYVQLR